MTTINFTNKAMYNTVMTNLKQAGKKNFFDINLSLLTFDSEYQRNGLVKQSRINKLVNNWDESLCDALLVSPHPEEGMFYIINGFHRYSAAIAMGRETIVCEVLTDLADLDPMERRIEEARIFAKQSLAVERLTATQVHNANVLLGIKANVFVRELCKKYGVHEKATTTRGNLRAVNTLTGMVRALAIAKKDINYLDDVFKTICLSGWNRKASGFTGQVIVGIENIFETHPDRREEIITALVDWFRNYEPTTIAAMATNDYPARDFSVRFTLKLEDYLHDTIDLPYLYTKKTAAHKTEKKGA